MPKFRENTSKPFTFNQDMLVVIKNFDDKGKTLVGHCAATLIFNNFGIGKGKKVALHPFIKSVVKNCIGTNEKFVIEGNLYTAQTENTIPSLMPELLNTLK